MFIEIKMKLNKYLIKIVELMILKKFLCFLFVKFNIDVLSCICIERKVFFEIFILLIVFYCWFM